MKVRFDLAVVFAVSAASPLYSMILPAEVLRVTHATSLKKEQEQHHGNRNSKVV